MKKKFIFAGLSALVLAVGLAYIYYLKYELGKAESELQVYSISNASLQKELGQELLFSLGLTNDLQVCLDSKSEFVRKINQVNLDLKKAQAKLVEKDKVVDSETLKNIIDKLNTPLPSFN